MEDVWEREREKERTFCAIFCCLFELFPSIFQHCNPAKLFVLTSNSTWTRRRADTASRLPLIITIFSPSPLNSFSVSSTIIESHYEGFIPSRLKIWGKKVPDSCARGKVFHDCHHLNKLILEILSHALKMFFLGGFFGIYRRSYR